MTVTGKWHWCQSEWWSDTAVACFVKVFMEISELPCERWCKHRCTWSKWSQCPSSHYHRRRTTFQIWYLLM